jgi:glycosyltransferase involved in cell wall biosynthesis
MLAVIFEYGIKIALRRATFREAFYTTKYINIKIGQLMKKKITPDEYVFTFQIQSLIDASTEVVPHFVYTDHTHLARLTYPDFDSRKLRSKKWIKMEQGIYDHAALIFTRSSNISKSLNEQYHISPEKMVLAGVGSNIEINDVKADNNNYSNKNILFVGNDWERKGGPTLLSAFQKILGKHPDARLTIVGSSVQPSIPNCESVGKIPVEMMGDYFRKASIFCLPTKLEPFGVAFIEALYYRLPILATNIGAIPDFVRPGENGYLVEPGDVDGLAHYLDLLLSDPVMCSTFGEHGYALATANYSWAGVVDKMSKAIRKTLSSSASEQPSR